MDKTYLDVNGIEVEAVDCNFCGSPDHVALFSGKDRSHGKPGVFYVVKCRQCGLVYTNPRPSPDQMGLYYPAEYGPHDDATEQDIRINIGFMNTGKTRPDKVKNWMKGIILDQYYGYDPEAVFGVSIPKNRLLRQCMKYALLPFSFYVKNLYYKIPRYVPEGKMLDAGCGSGGYIMMLRKLGWEVYGQDISGVALDRIKKDPMTHVLAGELSDQRLPENYFDLVTLWHSLEHMRDPMAVLKEVYRATKAGGNVFICVPNFSGIFRRVFKSRWFPLELPRHLYHFSPPILNKMVSRAGFKPGVTRYIPLRSLLPMSIRYMLAEKQKNTSIAESKMLLRACTWVQRLSAFFHQSDVILLQVTKR